MTILRQLYGQTIIFCGLVLGAQRIEIPVINLLFRLILIATGAPNPHPEERVERRESHGCPAGFGKSLLS
jgi:hypothetical protein